MVYLPHESDLPRWGEQAKAAGVSLSNFVFEAVENFIDTRNKEQQPRAEALQKMAKFREHLQATKDELHTTKLALKNSENENARLRMALNPGGWVTDVSKRVIDNEFFQIVHKAIELHNRSENINQKRESKDSMNAYQQLTALQDAGLIVETKDGWKRKEDAK